MIKKIDIASQGVDLTDDLKKYITKKVGKLDRYTPRHARKSVHAAVKLREKTSKAGSSNKYECEAILYLPNEQLTANEATLNMFAAVDIVETKLQNQLRRYKDRAIKNRIPHRRITRRLRRILSRETPEEGSE